MRRGCLTLISVPSKYGLRFGFVVGKKVGKAVVRNKVKRRLKEIVRAHIPQMQGNANYILIAAAETAQLDFAALQKNVLAVLKTCMTDKQV